MIKLIQNEFIKILSQTGYKVLLIILAALMILAPLGSFAYEKLITESYEFYDWADEVEEYADADNWSDKIYYYYYKARSDTYNLYTDNGLSTDGWLYESYAENYRSELFMCSVYELIAENFHDPDFMCSLEYSPAGGVLFYSGDEDAPYSGKSDIYSYDYDKDYPDDVIYNEDKDDVTLQEVEDYLKVIKADIAELEATILANDPTAYIQSVRDEVDMTCQQYEAAKAAADKAYELAPTDSNKYDADVAARNLDCWQFKLWMYDWILEHDLTPDDWQYTTAFSLFSYYVQRDGIAGVETPESLRSEYYDEDSVAASNENYLAMKEIIRRSFNDNTPIKGFGETETKTLFTGHIEFIAGLLTIFCIVLAAQIISQEYGTGTIRLLLIRPRSRNKIMTSKILTICLLMAGLLLASVVIMMPLDILLFGVGDLFDPEYVVMGGSVVTLPYILVFLKFIGFNFLSMMFFGIIALLIATLIRRSALSIVLSIIMEVFATSVQSIVFALSDVSLFNINLKWLRFTILPYLDLSAFTDGITDYYVDSMSWGTSYYSYYNIFSPWLGLIMVLAHTALLLWLIYLVFRKKQIKN